MAIPCPDLHRAFADSAHNIAGLTCPNCQGRIMRGDPTPTGVMTAMTPVAPNGGFRAIPPTPINHMLHLGLCLITVGLWAPVYTVVMVNYGMQQRSYQRYLRLRARGA